MKKKMIFLLLIFFSHDCLADNGIRLYKFFDFFESSVYESIPSGNYIIFNNSTSRDNLLSMFFYPEVIFDDCDVFTPIYLSAYEHELFFSNFLLATIHCSFNITRVKNGYHIKKADVYLTRSTLRPEAFTGVEIPASWPWKIDFRKNSNTFDIYQPFPGFRVNYVRLRNVNNSYVWKLCHRFEFDVDENIIFYKMIEPVDNSYIFEIPGGIYKIPLERILEFLIDFPYAILLCE